MGYQWLLSINGLLMVINDELMWVKQCHKPPVTGNGNHSTYKHDDDWGNCFTHIKQKEPDLREIWRFAMILREFVKEISETISNALSSFFSWR